MRQDNQHDPTLAHGPRTLIPIGGNEAKATNSVIFDEMTHRAGGKAARIVIVPTASATPEERGRDYERLFRTFEPTSIDVLTVLERPDASKAKILAPLREATLVMFSGGDQLRLSSLLGGTPLHHLLMERYGDGCIVAGTSAGAAVLPEAMIFQNNGFRLYRKGGLEMTMGLGLIRNVIFDTHFVSRSRISRLVHAVATNPSLLGFGLEENTALVIEDEERGYAIGAGTVIVVDGREAEINTIASTENRAPFAITNLRYSVLTHGVSIDLDRRQIRQLPRADHLGAKGNSRAPLAKERAT